MAGSSCRMLPLVQDRHHQSAEWIRLLALNGSASPAAVSAALMGVPPAERDAWADRVLGIDSLPEDGPELPRGCVPYLPCPVDALLRMVKHAGVQASDVFVDIGSGVGRAAALVHLLTGAATLGIEIQPALVRASLGLQTRVHGLRFSPIEGDAVELTGSLTRATVFFFYCPFSSDRLEKVLKKIEALAYARPIRVCCVDLPLLPHPWLELVSPPAGDLAVYRSTLQVNSPAPAAPPPAASRTSR
jgi:histone methylation protein DOT1